MSRKLLGRCKDCDGTKLLSGFCWDLTRILPQDQDRAQPSQASEAGAGLCKSNGALGGLASAAVQSSYEFTSTRLGLYSETLRFYKVYQDSVAVRDFN